VDVCENKSKRPYELILVAAEHLIEVKLMALFMLFGGLLFSPALRSASVASCSRTSVSVQLPIFALTMATEADLNAGENNSPPNINSKWMSVKIKAKGPMNPVRALQFLCNCPFLH
jgi:hypothetical protein